MTEIVILLWLTALAVVIVRLLRAASAFARPDTVTPSAQPAPAASLASDGQTIPCHDDDHAMASWIWKNLVPRSGESPTVQGELLRAVTNLRWEAVNNGNINWHDGYEVLLDFLYDQLVEQSTLPEEMKTDVVVDLGRLRHFITPDQLAEDRSLDHLLPCVDEFVYERLVAAVAEFSRLNPVIIQRPLSEPSTS